MLIIPYLQTNKSRSRRKIVGLIQGGQIFLNSEKIESYKTDLKEGDIILVLDNEGFKEEILVKIDEEKEVKGKLVLFNKPKGYVVSKADPHNATIYEILPEEFKNWYYIGRLDKDSRGLLLLTDSPKLVNEFEHPKFNIQKEYLIELSSPFREGDIQKVKSGVYDEGEVLKFLNLEKTEKSLIYKVTLNEGKKRHIRRVIKKLGYNLLDLQRIKEDKWKLPKNLDEGKWIFLN